MTPSLMVRIYDPLRRASEGELAVLEEITAARYEAWLEERAKYMKPSQNAITAARLADSSQKETDHGSGATPLVADEGLSAGGWRPCSTLTDSKDSSPSPWQAGDGSTVDAGHTTTDSANPAGSAPAANGAFSLASEEEQLGAEQQRAVVAWDLTLRCPVCNSNVEGSVRKYHCFSCAKKGGRHG